MENGLTICATVPLRSAAISTSLRVAEAVSRLSTLLSARLLTRARFFMVVYGTAPVHPLKPQAISPSRLTIGGVWILTLGMSIVAAGGQPNAMWPPRATMLPEAARENSWRNAFNCGPNALFVFLAAHGHSATLADVRNQIPVTQQGCSFADLERASECFGLSTQTIKTDLAQLKSCVTPAVVLLNGLGQPLGHFVVILNIEDESVTVLDPSTAVVQTVETSQFLRAWTGYALVPRRHSLATITLGVVQWLSLGCAVGLVLRCTQIVYLRYRKPNSGTQPGLRKPPNS
jgi:hypothetical protein